MVDSQFALGCNLDMNHSHLESARINSERGVSLVEFVLAFPIVAMLVFGIVDFARYYAVTGVLRAGAEQGINRARKIPNFDVAYNGMDPSDSGYVRFTQARDVVLNEAESVPLSSLLSDEAHPSGATLKNITVTDNGLNSIAAPPTVTRSAAVLRPGECADVSGHGQVCNGPVASGVPVSQLLQTYPIRVVLFAEIRPFLPFLGTMTARGEAYGQRENVPQGPVAGVVPPALAFRGSPAAPLPPVLPASGSKEPPFNPVTCALRPARDVIAESLGTGGTGTGSGKYPRTMADVPSSGPGSLCQVDGLPPNSSM